MLRVGEASHPGPNTIIGTANVRGLMGRSGLLDQLPADGIWGIAETHLTHHGAQKFHKELQFNTNGLRMSHGAYAETLSSTAKGAIGGKSCGVATISRWPTRKLTHDWSPELWPEARHHATASCVNNAWVKMGIAYGYATDSKNVKTVEKTDSILAQLTQRVLHESHGFRAIVGDFNNVQGTLRQTKLWRQAGWVDLQEYAQARWGQTPIQTSPRSTIIDHVWISPELVPHLVSVHVNDTYFPDHSIVYGIFQDLGRPAPNLEETQSH